MVIFNSYVELPEGICFGIANMVCFQHGLITKDFKGRNVSNMMTIRHETNRKTGPGATARNTHGAGWAKISCQTCYLMSSKLQEHVRLNGVCSRLDEG